MRQPIRHMGNVGPDDGEIAVLEFPNVRAATAGKRLRTIRVRVWSNASDKVHAQYLTNVRCHVNAFFCIFKGCRLEPNAKPFVRMWLDSCGKRDSSRNFL